MKKISLAAFLLFTFLQFTFSQYKAGYVIYNNNDTIRGYINWEGSIINSTKCEFKVNPDDEPTVYKPGEISAFRFNHSKFFSSRELNSGDQPKMVFIEWLIKGRASLLSYSGDIPYTKYFLLAEDGTITELSNSTIEIVKEGTIYQRKKQEYISTLVFNFRDCPSLQPKINSTAFNSKSLINITKGYHELTCKTEDCIVFEEKDRKMKLDWGIYTAFLSSKWKINNGYAENMYPAISLGGGISLNVTNLPALAPNFSIKINPAFFSSLYRYDTANVAVLKSALYYHLIKDNRICRIGYVKIPVQLSYRFSHKNFSPYLSAGGTINLRFLYKQYDDFLADFIAIGSYSNASFQPGIIAGIGCDYITSSSLRINLGYDIEFCNRIYGSFALDHSKAVNSMVYLRVYL